METGKQFIEFMCIVEHATFDEQINELNEHLLLEFETKAKSEIKVNDEFLAKYLIVNCYSWYNIQAHLKHMRNKELVQKLEDICLEISKQNDLTILFEKKDFIQKKHEEYLKSVKALKKMLNLETKNKSSCCCLN